MATTRESKQLNIPAVHEGSSFQSESSRVFGSWSDLLLSITYYAASHFQWDRTPQSRAICEYAIKSLSKTSEILFNQESE